METPARLDQREFFHPDCKVNPLLLDEVLSFVQPSNLILSKKIKGKWFGYKIIFDTLLKLRDEKAGDKKINIYGYLIDVFKSSELIF